jgi:hypothetical protein
MPGSFVAGVAVATHYTLRPVMARNISRAHAMGESDTFAIPAADRVREQRAKTLALNAEDVARWVEGS